jgi:hypothetical protein
VLVFVLSWKNREERRRHEMRQTIRGESRRKERRREDMR